MTNQRAVPGFSQGRRDLILGFSFFTNYGGCLFGAGLQLYWSTRGSVMQRVIILFLGDSTFDVLKPQERTNPCTE